MFSKGDRVVINGPAAAKAYGSDYVGEAWGGTEMTVVTGGGRSFTYLVGRANGSEWTEGNPLVFRTSGLELLDEPIVEEDWS